MIDDCDLYSRDNSSDGDDSSSQSPSPNRSYSSVDNSPGHLAHQETWRPPQDSSLASLQEPLPFNSDPPPDEPARPTVSPTLVNLPTHNLADTPSTNSSSLASPATLTNASPVSDSSTSLPAIRTVQAYLAHQAQLIQSHLTGVLPGLIREEVRTQCTQLAEGIGAQISSIREEVIRPTGDQDDPMLPSGEEGENEGSRGRGKRSARRSYSKGKGKKVTFTTESDSEAAETRRHHHPSQRPNNEDEVDEVDEDSENEGDKGISTGCRKYKRRAQALRVSIYSCSS